MHSLDNTWFSFYLALQKAAVEAVIKADISDWLWLKLDACDVKPALMESVKGVWRGDAVFGGNVQEKEVEYQVRRDQVSSLQSARNPQAQWTALLDIKVALEGDIPFLGSELIEANQNQQVQFI